MATQVNGPQIVFSAPAGADLSGSQFYFVKWSTGTLIACAAVTDVPVGVLQNKPTLGMQAEVVALGPTKLNADAAIAQGALIGTSADGQAVTKTIGSDTPHYVCGRALEGCSNAGEIISGIVNCVNPARAA